MQHFYNIHQKEISRGERIYYTAMNLAKNLIPMDNSVYKRGVKANWICGKLSD